MAWWFRFDAGFFDNAKVQAAGWEAAHVFTYALCVHGGLRQNDGHVPAKFLHPRVVEAKTRLPREAVEAGLAACFDAPPELRLLERVEDGAMIAGWGDDWTYKPTEVTDRVRDHRARKRNAEVTQSSPTVTRALQSVTDRYSPLPTVTDCNGTPSLSPSLPEEDLHQREHARARDDGQDEGLAQGSTLPFLAGVTDPVAVARPAAKAKKPKPSHNPEVQRVTEAVVGVLNQVTGASFRPTTGDTVRLVAKRLEEGRSQGDLELVVRAKAKEWLTDPKMRGYLRPTTLLGNEKFEGYLQAAKASSRRGAPEVSATGEDLDELADERERSRAKPGGWKANIL